MECGRCQLIDWADLQGKLDRVPSKLRSTLDKTFSKRRKQRVFHLRYPYGQLIIDKGRFVPPCGADVCSNCRLLAEETQYSQIPLALLLRNPVEVFIDYSGDEAHADESRRYSFRDEIRRQDFRFAPLRLIPDGELLGVFEVLDALIGTPTSRPGWSVSSGARSVWALAPLGNINLTKELSSLISEKSKHKVKISWKAETEPHWSLIQACTAHTAQWFTDLIVFPRGVLESSDQSSDLLNEMLIIGWKYSAALRQSSIEDSTIRDAVCRANIALPGGEMHHYAAMRHFLNVMTGTMPAYRSCHVVEEPAGPFIDFCEILEDALRKIRRSKKDDEDGNHSYRPIVMQPYHLKGGEAGFYSCRCSSLPGPRPPKPERFLDLPESYRDVIKSFRGEYSKLINLKSITLFSLPSHDRDGQPRELPDDITSVYNLHPSDFFSKAPKQGLSTSIFLKSPFLVSCIRMTGQSH